MLLKIHIGKLVSVKQSTDVNSSIEINKFNLISKLLLR